MTNRLIPTNAEPLYRQLMARIRDDVSSGVYPAESQIPVCRVRPVFNTPWMLMRAPDIRATKNPNITVPPG